MRSLFMLLLLVGTLAMPASVSAAEPALAPVPLIFDTDMGNDCDDVLALAMIHALQSRGECELLAVTLTKDHDLAAPYIDALNTFYGRGEIPVGACRSQVTPEQGRFLGLVTQEDDGELRYPHDLRSSQDAPEAVALLRKVLAAAEDHSVVICQVGFSTNLANLLQSPADEHSELNGRDLAAKKVKLLTVMAGAFQEIPDKEGKSRPYGEYNIIKDIASAQQLCEQWPTEILWSGYEVGLNLKYPHQSILQDYRYAEHHPVAESYILYAPPPHDRPTWDLTCVLQAVRPERGYFELSAPGRVAINEQGHTRFVADPAGRDRYYILPKSQVARILEAFMQLSSQPPGMEDR